MTSEKREAFREYAHRKHWNLVWRFVAGFTKFDYFVNSTHNNVFVNTEKNYIQVQIFLFLCLFEAEVDSNFDFEHIYEGQKVLRFELRVGSSRTFQTMSNPNYTTTTNELSPMEKYVLGYCLVNSAPTVSWEISIETKSLETFMWGLKSVKKFGKSIIHVLRLEDASETYLEDYPTEILQDISCLELIHSEIKGLGQALSVMKNLKSLFVVLNPEAEDTDSQHALYALQQLSHTNLANLTMLGVNSSFRGVLSYLRKLIHPLSGTLKFLCWLDYPGMRNTKAFFDLLFSPTSLVALITYSCDSKASFDLLKTNNNLKKLTIQMTTITQLNFLKDALVHNTVLEYITLIIDEKILVENCDYLKHFAEAIVDNRHLKELAIRIRREVSSSSVEQDYPELKVDSRIVIAQSKLEVFSPEQFPSQPCNF